MRETTSSGIGRTMQFFRGNPASGLWTLTLLVYGPVAGTRLSEPFTGAISFAPPQIPSTDVPNSPSTVLAAGQPVTSTIKVKNTGNIRKDYFADARLNERVPQALLGSDVNNVALPLSLTAQPNWLVPTGTDSLTVLAQGTVPITMDASFGSETPTSAPYRSATQPSETHSPRGRSRDLLRPPRRHRTVRDRRRRQRRNREPGRDREQLRVRLRGVSQHRRPLGADRERNAAPYTPLSLGPGG